MTHTLAGLTKAGYIEMLENEKDKRSKLIYITDAGRKFRDDAIRSLAPDVDEIARHFRVEDAEAIVPRLQSLRETLDKMRD
ncbi:MAG: winged helix DNA-binding protein [Symploca sp. SIO2B6]|nr:winged helix DNA-binding protein [Symploca sp. SIO2B6]